jgi:hypothetical protein
MLPKAQHRLQAILQLADGEALPPGIQDFIMRSHETWWGFAIKEYKRWDCFTMKHLDLTVNNTDSSMENTELPIS